jgi:hypothetical protein
MLKFNDVVIDVKKDMDMKEDKKEQQMNLYYQKKRDAYEV